MDQEALSSALKAHGKECAAKLDEWARGFIFGFGTGVLVTIGMLGAIMEPLK